MTSPEPIRGDRMSYFTMKTPSGRPKPSSSHSHSNTHSNTHSFHTNRSSTPSASPRLPYSVGQPHPPKLSSPTGGRLAPSSAASPAGYLGAQDARTPSPNYFGLTVEPPTDPRDSGIMPRENWSPPTSSVRSFAAVGVTRQLPLDANPDFEAFRRQADANRGRTSFSLSTAHLGQPAPSTPAASSSSRKQIGRSGHAKKLDSDEEAAQIAGSPTRTSPHLGVPPSKVSAADSASILPSSAATELVRDEGHDPQNPGYASADSKHPSYTSMSAPSFFNMGRHESPAHLSDSPFNLPEQRRSNLSKVDDRHPRLSLVPGKADPPTPGAEAHVHHRAETLPTTIDTGGPGLMNPADLRRLIENAPGSDLLLLDLRVSPQFAQARIRGALNLCIPTTLLKRATFNLSKLQQTFQADGDQEKFARWRTTRHLVLYDAFSSDRRDAVSAMNMARKFAAEGYTGSSSILRGGFNSFATSFPQLVDRASLGRIQGSLSGGSLSLGTSGGADPGLGDRRTGVAPVIGGVILPNDTSNANPFFGNIRQNQDLVDGVGQMDIAIPTGLQREIDLPRWLAEAAAPGDRGKSVADKFLHIELTEQSRMREAYSVFQTADNEQTKVQLSGIEKGVKNRYKDILPFEHTRVQLQGKADGSCDYINASHLKASRSHRRYIASQGPLPATFEDFWSVIWDQDVRVIVMLTAESEGGQLKCHPYWVGKEFGPMKLRNLSEKKVSLDFNHHRSSSHSHGHSRSTAAPMTSDSSSSTANLGSPPNAKGTSSGDASTFTSSPGHDFARRRANTTIDPETASNRSKAAGQVHPHRLGTSSETPHVIVRKFALSHAAHPFEPIREVTQLHYASWPDFGAPAQPSHLLALVELANVMQRPTQPATHALGGGSVASSDGQSMSRRQSAVTAVVSSPDDLPQAPAGRPMLVPCSAGCGRTGAFCTVDSVIDMMKRQRLRSVAEAGRVVERRSSASSTAQAKSRMRPQALRPVPDLDADGDTSMDEGAASADEDDVDMMTPLPDVGARHGPILNNEGEKDEAEDGHELDGLDTAWLGDDGVDLVARTVEDFREQRLSTVQSLRQFVLCYETVIEWVWLLRQHSGATGNSTRGLPESRRTGTGAA